MIEYIFAALSVQLYGVCTGKWGMPDTPVGFGIVDHPSASSFVIGSGYRVSSLDIRVTSLDHHKFFLPLEIATFSIYPPKSTPVLLTPRDRHICRRLYLEIDMTWDYSPKSTACVSAYPGIAVISGYCSDSLVFNIFKSRICESLTKSSQILELTPMEDYSLRSAGYT